MVRLTTYYDREINEKVFMVRGDEGYTRTTDTTCSLVTDWSNREASIDGVRIGVKYDVLRDMGASKVIIYNNDTVLGIYDWDDEDTETTIGTSSSGGFTLAYGVEHNIWAKYKGNDKCLGSKSKIIPFTYNIPASYKTIISFNTTPTQIDEVENGASLTGSVTITVNNVETSATHSRTIKLYVDNVYNQTITTPSDSNTQSFTITGLTKGKHNITAEVEGTGQIRGATKKMQVKVGYNVHIESYSDPFIPSASNQVVVSVYDKNNSPVSSASVSFGGTTATTNSSGLATFTFVTLEDGNYTATYGGSSSQRVTIKNANITGLTLNYEDGITTSNLEELLTVTVTGDNVENVPISWKYGTSSSSYSSSNSVISPTVSYTNANGVATANYRGAGRGNLYVRGEYGGANSTKIMEDVSKYWRQDSTNGNISYGYKYYLGGYNYTDPSRTYPYAGFNVTPNSFVLTNLNLQTMGFYGIYFEKLSNNVGEATSFSFSFDYLSSIRAEDVYLGLSHKGVRIGVNNDDSVELDKYSRGDNIKITYSASTDSFKLYVNNIEKTAYVETVDDSSEMSPFFFISVVRDGNAPPYTSQFEFNNLKFMTWRSGVV